MSPRHLILLLCLGTSSLHAATEFTDGLVPMDIVREFSGGTVYPSLPDDFPPMNWPADTDLHVIATTVQPYSQRILLRTSHSSHEIQQRLLAVLTVHGWTQISSLSSYYLLMCHDRYGQMTITTSNTGTYTRVSVSRSVIPQGLTGLPTCAEQQRTTRENDIAQNFFSTQLPVLEVPAGTVQSVPRAYLIGGSSSFYSNDGVEISRDGVIQVPDTTVADLYEHFAAQMQEQGWQVDSSDAGQRGASSVWLKSMTVPGATTSTEVMTTLTLLLGVDAHYSVQLRLQSLPKAGGGLGIIGIFGGSSIVRDFIPIPVGLLPLNEPQLGIRGIPAGYIVQ
jgi:hypothetical protein